MAKNLIQIIRSAFGKDSGPLDADQGLPTMQGDTGDGASEGAPPFRIDGNPRYEKNRGRVSALRNHPEISDAIWRREIIPLLQSLNEVQIRLPGEEGDRIASQYVGLALHLATVVARAMKMPEDPERPTHGHPEVYNLRILEHACGYLRKRGAPTIRLDRVELPAYASAKDEWYVVTKNSQYLKGMFGWETRTRVWNALMRATNWLGQPWAIARGDVVYLNVTRLCPAEPPELPRRNS